MAHIGKELRLVLETLRELRRHFVAAAAMLAAITLGAFVIMAVIR